MITTRNSALHRSNPIHPCLRTTLALALWGFIAVFFTPAAPLLANDCLTIGGIDYCPTTAGTRLLTAADGESIVMSSEGASTLLGMAMELPLATGFVDLRVSAPGPLEGIDEGEVFSLRAEDGTGEQAILSRVARSGGETLIATSAESGPGSWRFYFDGQAVAADELGSVELRGSGDLFTRILVTQDGEVTYHWADAPFELADGTVVNELRWTSDLALGELRGASINTHVDNGFTSLNDWTVLNQAVIGCNPKDWAEPLGSPFADGARDVATVDWGPLDVVTRRGEVYVTGQFRGATLSPASFGDSATNLIDNVVSRSATDDVFVAKLDDCGRWLWVRTAGSHFGDDVGHAVAVDRQRHVLVVGQVSGTGPVDADLGTSPTPANFPINISGPAPFVAKYDKDGDLIWFKTFGSGAALDVDTDSNNDVFVAVATGSGSFILKLHGTTGSLASAPLYMGSDGQLEATGVAVGPYDHLCVVGNFTGEATIDGYTIPPAGTHASAFLARIDSSLNVIGAPHGLSSVDGKVFANTVGVSWQGFLMPHSKIRGPAWDPYSFDYTSLHCVVGGSFETNLSLGSTTLMAGYSGDQDGFVARIAPGQANPDGVILVQGSGPQTVEDLSIAAISRGSLWVTGSIGGGALISKYDYPDNPSPIALPVSHNGREAFAARYKWSGGWVSSWKETWGHHGDDDGMGVAVLPRDYRAFAVGNYDTEAEFSLPNLTSTDDLYSPGFGDQGYVAGILTP